MVEDSKPLLEEMGVEWVLNPNPKKQKGSHALMIQTKQLEQTKELWSQITNVMHGLSTLKP
jgi:hypothetical protein